MECTELNLNDLTHFQLMYLNLATSAEIFMRVLPFLVIVLITLLVSYSGYNVLKSKWKI